MDSFPGLSGEVWRLKPTLRIRTTKDKWNRAETKKTRNSETQETTPVETKIISDEIRWKARKGR